MNRLGKKLNCKSMFLLALIGLMVLTGCTSQTYGWGVGRFVTCEGISASFQPLVVTDNFLPSVAKVYLWFELTNTVSGVYYYFLAKWIEPGLSLYGTSSWVTQAGGTALYDYCSMVVAGAKASTLLGEWKVSLSVAGGYGSSYAWAFDKTFRIGQATPQVKTFSVMLDADPKVTSVVLDGNPIPAGTSVDLKEGEPHVISVKDIVEKTGEAGIRYVFKEWSDGVTERTRTIKVIGPAIYTAVFTTQYYLRVESEQGEVKGADWYNRGAQAQAVLNVGRIGAGLLEDWVFVKWTGGASGTDLKSKPIVMDGPKTATAEWQKQFSVVFYVVVVVVALLAILIVIFIFFKQKFVRRFVPVSRPPPPPPPPSAPPSVRT